MERLIKRFNELYEFLYNNNMNTDGIALEFDELMKNNKYFACVVKMFVERRGDFISSDRECAAFLLAIADYMS